MHRSPLRPLLAAAAAAVLIAGLAAPAAADTRPSAGTPSTVSSDPLATAQIDGVAWTQVAVGHTVYVGGLFSTARPAHAAPGEHTVKRGNLLAFSLTTGKLLPWAPKANGVIRAMTRSSDGKTIYAVGNFTTVNGHKRNRIVAIDARSGAVNGRFHPSLNALALSVAVHGSTVYAGGQFTSANGRTRTQAAAFNRTTGSVRAFAPELDGAVYGIVISSDGGRAVLGGRFSHVNGKLERGTEKIDTKTGRRDFTWHLNSTVQNHGPGAAIWSLASYGGYVYGTGYSYHPPTSFRRLEGTFVASWSTGTVRWIEDCHGDEYSVAPTKNVVYIAGHPHFCGNIGGFPDSTNPQHYQRALAFSSKASGTVKKNTVKPYTNFGGQKAPTLLTWFPDFNTGTVTGMDQGPWNVGAHGAYLVYVGEFTTVNGAKQQGLVRFATSSLAPDEDGPRLKGTKFEPTATVVSGGVRLTWPANYDRDNQHLTVRIYRGSTLIRTVTTASRIWFDRPVTTITDSAGRAGSTYHLVARDPFGNSATGATVTAH